MHIVPFADTHIEPAAGLFCAGVRRLRARVPALPGGMAQPEAAAKRIARLAAGSPAFAAVDGPGGRLLGYLGGFLIDGFRGTARRAAYAPEYGFALAAGQPAQPVTAALYRAAAAAWCAEGAQAHAVTILADDDAAREAWFWHGFGLAVVDAVRPLSEPIAARPPGAGTEIRQAGPDDAPLLALLEAEHAAHYSQPPTLMVPTAPDGPAEFAALLAEPPNSAWLAYHYGLPAGYLRLQAVIDGGAAVLNSPHTIGVTGLYLRPEARGLGLAAALLETARRHYAALTAPGGGPAFTCYATDFESINPEAAAFWPRHFQPVTFSLIRVPERV